MHYSVTIALLTFNDEKIIETCLKSIRNQTYKGDVQILLVDGGSTDKTLKIAEKYKCIVLSHPELRDHPNKRAQISLSSITSDIAIIFSADNRFQENHALEEMIKPFNNKKIAVVQTFKYGFYNESSLLTKYFALIGGADPIAVELGRADRAPYDTQKWHSFGTVTSFEDRFEVVFKNDANKLPTLGANGIAVRNSLLKKFPIEQALHTEMCLNFIQHGYNTFAFVKPAHIVHEIHADIISFCKRRLQWATLYSESNVERGYKVFDIKRDLFKILYIVFIAVTFIVPFLRALKGCFTYRHKAWFLHPIVLFIFVLSYGIQTIINIFRRK